MMSAASLPQIQATRPAQVLLDARFVSVFLWQHALGQAALYSQKEDEITHHKLGSICSSFLTDRFAKHFDADVLQRAVTFRERIKIGETSLSPQEVQVTVQEMGESFKGNAYHLLQR